jgi:hypothetical protein
VDKTSPKINLVFNFSKKKNDNKKGAAMALNHDLCSFSNHSPEQTLIKKSKSEFLAHFFF